MHNKMRVGYVRVNSLDSINRQDIPSWRPRELVGAVTGAAGNRKRIDVCVGDELFCFVRVCQHLIMR